MSEGAVAIDDPRADDIGLLLQHHLTFTSTHSPPEDVHVLDTAALLDPGVTFFSYRADGLLLGIGAIRELAVDHGELKSMHTAEPARRQGVAAAMVEYLVEVARARRYSRVGIETGTQPAFAPARSLYASRGFVECEPFGDYSASPSSVFMTLRLGATGPAS